MSADRVPISRGIAPLADIPDREGGDGGPELVIRGEHPWLVSRRQAMPVLPRRRHEIGQPVQEVTRREFDDAAGVRRDPDAGVNRKPTVLSSEHVGGRIGVEEPLHAEPPHNTTAHLLGERGQIGLGDRPGRQERRRPATGWHEDAVGRARMEMHMVIERRSEAVQQGHGTESWASRARPVTVTGQARRSTEQPLDLFCTRRPRQNPARTTHSVPCRIRSRGCHM